MAPTDLAHPDPAHPDPSPDAPLRIGTRGSPLALAQAHETRDRLARAHDLPETAFEIVVIQTTGDAVQDRALSEIGGKGLFTKEIEEGLLAGRIDIAVHSMKDMPTVLPDGLAILCLLPREDVRDVLIGPHRGIAALPEGAVVGSSSLRRRAQLLHRRPDLRVVEFRGNVQTRLRKLSEGVAEATFLAAAGLRRLGHDIAGMGAAVEPEEMLPAVAQGAIGIEGRTDDARVAALLAPIHDGPTATRLAAERAFLAGLDGSCRTPIGGLAVLTGGRVHLRGEIIRPDGSERHATNREGVASDAAAMGADAAAELRARGGDGFFD